MGKGDSSGGGGGEEVGKERSIQMEELKSMLLQIEKDKDRQAAVSPVRQQNWNRDIVPQVLCLLIGWVAATIYHQETIFAPPCAVCAVSEDFLATSPPSTKQPQSAGNLPPLRVAVVDERRGPGAISLGVQRQAFQRVGFRVTEELQEPYDFDVLWSHHSVNASEHNLTAMHRVNHIPGMSLLCQKAQFGRFAHEHRLEYVPRYYTSSARDATYLAADLQNPSSRFVVKNRGHRGVRMMTAKEVALIAGKETSVGNNKDAETPTDSANVEAAAKMLMSMLSENVVQQFIADGLLVDGHKFDFAVYCYIETFSPSVVAYTLENVLIRVVPRPFPTSESEWLDNKRLIVQDEYLTPWSLPTFKKLWTRHARGTLDAFLMQTLQAGHTQVGGYTGGAMSAEAAKQRVDALWERVRAIIWNTLQMANANIQETMQQQRRNGLLNYDTFEFVRYDFMADRQLNPWLIEVNMSPNMIPHDGEAHQDTQWRVAVLQQVAALAAGHPEAVPSATQLSGELVSAATGAQVPEAYAELRQLCLDDPSWRWSCDVPAVKTPRAFSGACECTLGRLVQHRETKHYRCEKLGPACGDVGFESTLGYPVDFRWYATADGSEADDARSCGAQ